MKIMCARTQERRDPSLLLQPTQPSFTVVRMEEVDTPNQRCEKGREEAEQGDGCEQVVPGDDRMERKEEGKKEKQQL